jgi:hypothetical protein
VPLPPPASPATALPPPLPVASPALGAAPAVPGASVVAVTQSGDAAGGAAAHGGEAAAAAHGGSDAEGGGGGSSDDDDEDAGHPDSFASPTAEGAVPQSARRQRAALAGDGETKTRIRVRPRGPRWIERCTVIDPDLVCVGTLLLQHRSDSVLPKAELLRRHLAGGDHRNVEAALSAVGLQGACVSHGGACVCVCVYVDAMPLCCDHVTDGTRRA